MDKFYKLARPNGWDFYTGKTINYRENIGKIVKCPKFDEKGILCSVAFIHASRGPNQCFVGANIPCSAYLVSGKPIKEDSDKCGFGELLVEKELIPKELFQWDYETACNPINPFELKPPVIGEKEINLLKKWDSVWASVGDSVWASVWASVRASVGASVGDSVWDSVRASVWASVRASVGASVGDSVWDSVRASVGASVRAYTGKIFEKCVEKWKHVDHNLGVYPFQSAIDLWSLGLIASFDKKIWRLHGGEKAKVLYEMKKEK